MHPKALWRSADSQVTSAKIKEDTYEFSWSVDNVADRLERHDIHAWVGEEIEYPFKLHNCTSKPYILYYHGNEHVLEHALLAIVGPRKPSSYLTQVTKDICALLPQYQVSTISGGAQGIDELVHRSCMAGEVPTIVVLWAWFRRIRSSRQRSFLEEIVAHGGLVLSERKIDQEPTTYTFPQRNRIIAGVADALFVPWAGSWSWSLITVDFACGYHIPVATVPGSIYDLGCAGTNRYLIEKKIMWVTNFADFLSTYFTATHAPKKSKRNVDVNEQERNLLDVLSEHAYDITTLTHMTGQDIGQLMHHLLHLEIKQLIYCPEPGKYAKK